MRLVFFNRSFYPDVTATGQLLTELCQGLVKEYGWQVTVITGRPMIGQYAEGAKSSRRAFIRREIFEGIEIVRVNNSAFDPRSFMGRISNYLTYFIFSFFASFTLQKPDVVVTLTDPPIVVMVGLWVSLRYKIPFVVSMRDLFPEAARGLEGAQNKFINFLLDRQNRFCLKKATHVVALGNSMRDRLIRDKGLKDNKVSIIPDWADTEAITPVAKENGFSIRHGLARYFVVMYAGNIGASSGLEFVIDTAVAVRAHKDILFVFVGEGILKQRLITLARGYQLENIKFFPFQPKEMLSDVFSSADCFLLPLKKGLGGYSIPSKVYAILASGRPYVACVENDSDIAQITREFDCGIVSPPQDSLALAEKVLFLYGESEQRIRLGLHAREASRVFDRRVGIKKYHDLFKDLLHTKKGN